MYICLNVLYCFPEIWDAAAGKTEDNDYRDSKSYQNIIALCIPAHGNTFAVNYPHRLFFGLSNRHLPKAAGQWGTRPFNGFLSLETSAIDKPSIAEAYLVRVILISKGLPVELAVGVMRFVGYEGKRRLTIPNDPFHPSNKEELVKYLNYCWKLLICCDILAKALGKHINRYEEVSQCIHELWSCGGGYWIRPVNHSYCFCKPRNRKLEMRCPVEFKLGTTNC